MNHHLAGTIVAIVAIVLAGAPSVTHAQGLSAEERQAAAEAAYDRGTRAFRTDDFDSAARWYETANELAPSANALVQAIRSHERSGNFLRAATLGMELTSQYGEERFGRYAAASLERATAEGVRVEIACTECEITVNGEPEPRRTVFLRRDTEHLVVATFATGTVEERVLAGPGETRTLALEAPPPPEDGEGGDTGETGTGGSGGTEIVIGGGGGTIAPVDEGGGISPAFFFTGLALTVVAGGVLAWSGFDTLEARDDYVDNPTRDKLDDGRELERRTNILIGATAGLGAVTILLLALTDFSGDAEEPRGASVDAAIAPLPEGGLVLAASGSLP